MKRRYLILVLLAFLLILTGCSIRTVEQMYCLPKRSEDHNDLQAAIDKAMSGLSYCAPLAGENQQTVQMADLNGDGVVEYLVFTKANAERPLRVLVFQEQEDAYVHITTIESNGTAFDQVEYVQMDERPGVEVVVGRQLSDKLLRSVSVYTLTSEGMEQLVTDNYVKFLTVKFGESEVSELFVIHTGQTETDNAIAELYTMRGGVMERYNEVSLSFPADKLKRILVGQLHDIPTAVYVAGAVGDTALVTDVFSVVDGKFTNVAVSNKSGTGVQTMRNYYVYADDIDNDGVVELPFLIDMVPRDATRSSDRHNLIRWYAMTSGGEKVNKLYTYHNFVSGWYLELGDHWAPRLTIESHSGNYEFYLWDSDLRGTQKLMTIYALTGQNREEQSREEGKIILQKTDSVIYTATLEEIAAEHGIDEESITRSFHLIHQDWKTGEI